MNTAKRDIFVQFLQEVIFLSENSSKGRIARRHFDLNVIDERMVKTVGVFMELS